MAFLLWWNNRTYDYGAPRSWGQTREASFRNLGRHSGYCFCCNPLFASIDSLTLFSPMANDPLGHHADRSPQCGVPQASALSLLARNERRARSKGEQRRLSERNTGSSPVRRRSINNYPAAAGGDLSATSIGALLAWSASHCLFRLTHSPYFRLWRMTHRVTTRIVPHAAVNGLGRDDILGALLCGSHVC